MLLTRSPLYSEDCSPFLVRLACVRHAASVDSEPGSNSRLKPDAYRRVEGRLPSPHIQCSLQKPLWFQQRGMAPPFSLRLLFRTNPEEEEKFTVVYLVRSLGLMPEFVSHDWHVQPSCQRPNRGPPKRREFSPGGDARVRSRLSSKPYKHTCGVKSCQSTHPTGFPDVFHKWTVLGSSGRRARPAAECVVPEGTLNRLAS